MGSFVFEFDRSQDSSDLTDARVRVPLVSLESDIDCAAQEHWCLDEAESMRVFHSAPIQSGEDIESATFDLYRQILAVVPVKEIYRIWNYVPDINAEVGTLDRYMRFCKGRADVFQQSEYPESLLSAASALGYEASDWKGGSPRVIAVVMQGQSPILPLENPRQIPAYRYPQRYGPKAPSFARAALVGTRFLVSGTASILDSESQHPGDPFEQACLAADNVQTLIGLSEVVARGKQVDPLLRVYVRHADDWPEIRRALATKFDLEAVKFVALQAQICRDELLVELEYASNLAN